MTLDPRFILDSTHPDILHSALREISDDYTLAQFKADKLREQRNELILAIRAWGMSVDKIAKSCNMSKANVSRIITTWLDKNPEHWTAYKLGVHE